MLIDTHKAIEKMIAVGSTKENAEVIVEIINSQNDNVATKGDMKILESQIESVKSEINSVRSEINTIKWMLGLGMAIIVMLISSMKF